MATVLEYLERKPWLAVAYHVDARGEVHPYDGEVVLADGLLSAHRQLSYIYQAGIHLSVTGIAVYCYHSSGRWIYAGTDCGDGPTKQLVDEWAALLADGSLPTQSLDRWAKECVDAVNRGEYWDLLPIDIIDLDDPRLNGPADEEPEPGKGA